MVDTITIHQEEINIELSTVAIKMFASMIGKDYENAIIDFVGYSYACKELLHVSRINHYYEELRDRFPLCHFVFATIVSSSYYTIPTEKDIINEDELTSQVDLHRKHRMILSIFCSLL